MEAVYASPLDRQLRFLAVTLAWFADDSGGRAYPSADRLAAMLGCSDRQVRRGLDRLRQLGVVVVESGTRTGDDGRPRPVGGKACSTRYRFDLEALNRIGQTMTPMSGFGVVDRNDAESETLTSMTPNPDIRDTKPCHPRPETLTPASGDPSGSVDLDPSGILQTSALRAGDEGDERKEPKERTTSTPAAEWACSCGWRGTNHTILQHSRPHRGDDEHQLRRVTAA